MDTNSLFLSHPDPMWIYDLETLQFLAVNNSAIAKYGYTREEFLGMKITDIRPAEDIDALEKSVASVTEGRDEAGIWRHRLKSGLIIHVDITGHTLEFKGRRAELISARDISRLVIAEQIASEGLAREQAARRASDSLARNFQLMFDSVPGVFIAYSPDGFDVIAISEAALEAMSLRRQDVLGKNLFEIMPYQPDDSDHEVLRGSITQVLGRKCAVFLNIQSYLVKISKNTEETEIRHWAVTNSPVIDQNGRILQLILRMQDITDMVTENVNELIEEDRNVLGHAKVDMVVYNRALVAENSHLAELATKLRITQRLLGTGTWEYVLSDDRLNWSNNVYTMYGVSAEHFGHRFEDYVSLVHPDDRKEMRANFSKFMTSGDAQFMFAHRVCHADGKIVHVKGLAERTETPKGTLLSGAVQDVTGSIEAARSLERAKRMLEIAGSSAKFGAWRYDVVMDHLEWSPQTARIHEELDTFSPTISIGLQYYVEEHRAKLESYLKICLENGVSFDDNLEITTAKGSRKWVRVTGEAERAEDGRVVALHGSIQDISELLSAKERAEESERLIDIAGRAVKLGGWRVSLVDGHVSWTNGIAALHELPPGTSPSLEGGINYFAPEEQEDARRVFEACANEGIPFDNVRNLVTAKGNRIRVRSFGEPVRNSEGKIIAVQGAMQDVSELTSAQDRADALTVRLADMLENIGDAFLTIDRNWRFSYLNSRAEAILQRQRDSLIGRKIFDAFPDAKGSEFEVQYKRAFKTQKTVRFEQFFPPLNRLFSISAHPANGELAVYFTDVTDERMRDEQLRLLGAAVARINDIIVITESGHQNAACKYKIVYVNDAFEKITGFAPEEVIGQTPKILQGPRTSRSELNRIQSALEAYQPVRTELINYSKSGKEYLQEIDIVPVANATGIYTHFVATQRDVTEQRLAEEALRHSETRFRLIAKATGNAIWDYDVVNDRQWWSEELTTIFGHKIDPEGKMPTVWRANVHPDDEAALDRATEQLLSGQADFIHDQYRFRRADGSWANVEDRAFAIRDETGSVVRVLGSMADVSERLQVEERLRQSQKLEAVGQLTGGVAHDFNNLLTIILGNSEMLRDALNVDSPLRPYADMIDVAADRAAQLTNRLLAFSRRQALRPQKVDINVVIAGLDEMLRRTLGENIDIEIVRAGGLWQTEVDIGQLEAALLNLAVNARDAMPDGGALTFETANTSLDDAYVATEPGLLAGQYVLVAVSDTGHGISAENLNRVFEPFFTTKAVGKGTGLGLSMVHGFVKQSGGHVRIYSEPGEGTTVKMYFPRSTGGQKQPVTPSQRKSVLGGRETILLVEDNQYIRQQLTVQLESLGYKVFSVNSGQSALAILKERTDIDLLFTDVVLPGGMNGRQVADAAKVLRPKLKVLYTSGYSANAIVHQGRLDPGVELLSKPYRRAEMAEKLRKVLDSD